MNKATNKTTISLALVCGMFVGINSANAQPAEQETTLNGSEAATGAAQTGEDAEKLKQLEAELAAIRERLAEMAAEETAGDTKIDLHAIVNVEFEKQTSDQGKGDPNGSLDADVAELLVNARRGRVSAALAVDLEHGVDTERALGTVNVGFGFLEYSFSDALRLRAGKILNPFGFYNEIHTAKSGFPSVKEASSTLKPYRLSKTGFRYAPKWESAVVALGSAPLGEGTLDYTVALGNGENIAVGSGDAVLDTNPYDEDNNGDKSLTARLLYRPVTEFTFGVSLYRAGLSEEGETAVRTGSLRSFGAYAHYTGGSWFALAEISHGRLEPTAGGAAATELGWVGTLGYRINGRWMPFAQVERLAAERRNVEDWGMTYTVGLNVTVKDGLLMKLDNNYFKGSANNGRLGAFPNHAYNEIKAGLTAAV